MTNASSSVRKNTEYRFSVPCEEPHGGDAKDFGVAWHWAINKAKELGIDTNLDNWCTFHCEDDVLVIVVVEVGKEVLW